MRKALLLVALLSACIEGPMGPPGPQGEAGPQGASGSGLASATYCEGAGRFGSFSVVFSHDIYRFSDGSTLATCALYTSATGFQSSFLWPSGSRGAEVGGCFVRLDVDTSSSGEHVFEMSSEVSSIVTYDDSGSSEDNRAFVLSCKKF